MIAIVNYGMGNLASVKKALDALSLPNLITDNHEDIKRADAIILPGVGSFHQGMQNLEDRGLVGLLTEEVLVKKKQFLGICLGMQLIFKHGTEPYPCAGLGWIDGTVIKFEDGKLRVPHMGWNTIVPVMENVFPHDLNGDYYFIHTYHAVPENSKVVAAKVNYMGEVVASVKQDNIFATQFHPEKSQKLGLALLSAYFQGHA
ncbi:MAG: imidazole glycerol phosphate synthase subunit HisH [Cytophagales bacterium CG12_big_fil_rev_8_21_14_0_65_40_12]|nr:MAG: imidazole glycerol phosphate synthase subunit HisH [Cytophagales bacterium CG12_big_fil_rev_8_21_14_0_65_40_12]PIW02796.1 MAG: imidazole glycerol phosphate synthase subunit HisH [Cytophagales bacterium CG17_big_fil_post_rev_8_21_14_2_50_40_13]